MKKYLFIALLVIVGIIQFIPSGRPEVIEHNANDFILNNNVPENIQNILRASCYDCHSNESVFPWYSYVAPVSWLVNYDINEGKSHLNFSDWESLSKLKRVQKIDECAEEIIDGEMPMKIYTLMHSEAELSDLQKEEFMLWAETYAESLFEE